MIWYATHLFLVINTALALPQITDHQSVKNFSPPEEVNALEKSQIVQRSISDHVESQNTEETIKEVETLIKSNPDLPRLTRGEILDILDNITRQDQNQLLQTIGKNGNRDPKAFMVVKAYTPLGSGEVNVEEFYTKPPITSIVESDYEDPKAEQVISSTSTHAPYFKQKTATSVEDKKITNVERKKPYRGNAQFKTSTTLSTTLRSRSSTSTTNLPPTTRKEIKRRRRPPVTTTTMMTITTYRPRGRLPPKKEIKYPNHKYPEDVSTTRPSTFSSYGIKVVEPPKFAPTQINYELEDLLPQEVEKQEVFIPMKAKPPKKVYSDDKINSISEPSIELEIPEHLKKVVADLNLAAVNSPDAVSVTSIVSPSEKDEGDKLKDILASIGVLPPSTTSTELPDANVVADSLSPDMQELLKSFGLLPDPSTEIQQQNQNDVSGFNPEKAEIHRDAYVGFKPLPEDNDGRKEMEDLLEQFGLLDKNSRKSKSLRTGKSGIPRNPNQDIQIEKISIDAVPEDLQPVLRQMGFGQRTERKIRENPKNQMIANSDFEENAGVTEKQHVFNPAKTDYVSDEEMRKLGRLLEVMKKLEKLNGTITEEDLKDIDRKELQDLIVSLQAANKNNLKSEHSTPLDEQNAPNPIEYDFGLSKNEVKRQQGTITSTETVETVTADTATEETKTPSIKDLEDSFGGGVDTAVTEALPETTTPKRTGFYYLLDWNTFLDIDDQKGKRVNLRLQPKVGDPKQFLNIKVP